MTPKKEAAFFAKLGRRIKSFRLNKGWTQEQMADHGFSIRFYQRVEAGKPVHVRTLLRLAEAFGVRVGEMFLE